MEILGAAVSLSKSFAVNCQGLCEIPGEGNGIPLQCSCLENPRDGGAWWAAVYGVAQSRTQLKRLSGSSSEIQRSIWELTSGQCSSLISLISISSSAYKPCMYFWQLYAWIIYTATAKSFQSCPTLCDPIDGSPPGSPVPGILQARTLQWVAISFSNAWKWKIKVNRSVMPDS